MKCGLCCEIWGGGVAQREGFTHIPLSAFAFLGEVAVVSVSPFTLKKPYGHVCYVLGGLSISEDE